MSMRPHPNVIRYRRYETEPLPAERDAWRVIGVAIVICALAAKAGVIALWL